MKFGSLAVAVAFSLHTLAAPTPVDIEERADSSVTPITAATIASYAPYVNFAAATYCSGIASWSCTACKRVPGFVPYATGGDGNGVQYWYVGWWPSGSSVVVAHEGTDPTQFLSVLTDVNAFLEPLDPALFPGVSSNVQVHSGFKNAHASTASAVLAAVKKVITDKGAIKVTTVGHSLGGAIAALDALYLKKNLPSTISIKAVTYGQPRVGNQEFADLTDKEITDFSRITNLKDDIPIVPGRGLGYHHSSGEKHIKSTGIWNACVGQDNTSTDCSTGAVENILVGNVIDHLGPYEGVWIGTISC
ncbi:lipase [Rhizoctonia solani 123E]|uniref:Lipase n=1 Tax=Rhizoctonia solani 123E TaxID=1423351 RepID=A0A074RU21_9AGAM|nr:lipase [Rhizoctonia solani 123E]